MTPDTPRQELPFVADCRTLAWRAPLAWLAAGALDLRRAPRLMLVYGFAIFALSCGVSLLAWTLGRFALLATLLSGFIYIAPVLAIGLHAVARDLERGRVPTDLE